MPLISVLVPAYNRADTIESCLRSALENSERDLEVIVSDNGSTDGTAAIVDAIARDDRRVRLIRQETNRGPLPNWRACLDAATAPLVHWLWSDDAVEPTFYRELIDGMRRRGAAMAMCGARVFDPDAGWSFICGSLPDVERSGREFIELALIGTTTLVSPAAALLPTAACRAHFSDGIRRWPGIDCNRRAIGCDVAMILGSALSSDRVFTHPEPLARFRHHQGSISVANQGITPVHYAHARIWWTRRNRLPRRLNRHDYARLIYHRRPLLALRDLIAA